MDTLTSLPLRAIKINDAYWNKYIKLIPEVVIPYQWEILNDRVKDAVPSHCLQNFRIAAGEADGERRGTIFQDSDVGKWLEAVAYSLESTPNPDLEKTADEVIELIGRAQCEDGYINTYFTLVENGRRWENLSEGHELYCAGHLIEAAVAYYNSTGKDRFLQIMCRFADLICSVFGSGEDQIHGYPGHQEIELALVKLYHATGTRKYLDTAKYFIDERGQSPNYFLEERAKTDFKSIIPEFAGYKPLYSQSHLPVREQTTAEGHAVRAVYMYCAMADLAAEYHDAELLRCCESIWTNIVKKRIYLTGSIGSSAYLERFTTDFDLPNDRNYSESCASIGLALFGLRMSHITRDASYVDIVERTLYNTVRAGISLDGNHYFYVNPLEVWPENCLEKTSMEHVKPVRQKWFDVACCPTNIARTLTSLGQYIYAADENSLYVNLFTSGSVTTVLNRQEVSLETVTDFPRTPEIKFHIRGGETEFPLCIRIPAYAENFRVSINGRPSEFDIKKHYACITKVWQEEEVVVTFDMPARLVSANPNVHADSNRVAIVRGPEVFCLEETDNFKNLPSILVSRSAELSVSFDPALFGGCNVVTCAAKKISTENWNDELYQSIEPKLEAVQLKAIPYGYWCNRTPGEMIVWLNAEF